jgi:hypothetical protein
MPNYRMSLDLSDLQQELSLYDLREYRLPFTLYILEADNPDEACHKILRRIQDSVMKQSTSIETRILCRKIRRYMRLDKVECL